MYIKLKKIKILSPTNVGIVKIILNTRKHNMPQKVSYYSQIKNL